MKPRVVSAPRIPSHLADDAQHPPLYGHYAQPISPDASICKQEATARGKDVINLLTALRNNNAEMQAIRHLNE